MQLQSIDLTAHLMGLAVALGVGLLVGVERERSKRDEQPGVLAGIRTFALLGLMGAVASLIGEAAIYSATFFLTLIAASALSRRGSRDPGMTALVAMLLTFFIGILAMASAPLAAGLGVALALLLSHRRPLHRLSRQWLSERDVHDLLILAGAAFVILPLMPDRTIDPWTSLNPRRLWVLVVAMMAVASVGYLALRAFGARFGLALAGLASGFVSSTATVAAMGQRARENPALIAPAASAAVLSNVGTIVQLAVVLGTLAPALLARLLVPLIASGLIALAAAVVVSWRSWTTVGDVRALTGGRPFELWAVFRFVGVLAGIVLVCAVIRQYFGTASVPWLMIPAGLADVHAAAASAAQSLTSGQMHAPLASWCVALAFTANGVFKSALARITGGPAYAVRVVPCILAVLGAFALTLAATPSGPLIC